MHQTEQFLRFFREAIWSTPLLLFLLGTGFYLTYLLRGLQFRYLGFAIKQVFSSEVRHSEGDIGHFDALMTSLAGAIGTGTIVGVATALAVGGVGSMFWMWLMAFVGMATKYGESLLAVKYRSLDEQGEMLGGPMQYMEKGLGWKSCAMVFAMIGAASALTTGNLVQVNAIAQAVSQMWQVNLSVVGLILAILTGGVILGGVKSIGQVAGVLVPVMALFYIVGGIIIIGLNFAKVPLALQTIFISAFKGQAAAGGFMGASVMMAVQMGVARSIFSNEAGLGISSIAAAAAKTDAPARQAMVAMTGSLLSTVIVCSITGLALAVTDVLGKVSESGQALNGAAMAIASFDSSLPGGAYIVTIGLILFSFSTIIAWAYYGEKCFEYLFGARSIKIYRFLFTLIVIPGALVELEMAWLLADITNGLMVIPNLIAVLALSPVIVSETRDFLKKISLEEDLKKQSSVCL